MHDISSPAPTGEIETTMEVACYGFSGDDDYKKLRFWDLPGFGTQKNSLENFFERESLYVFDCLIIFTDQVLDERELQLLKEARDYQTPTAIVITKANDKATSKLRKRGIHDTPTIEQCQEVVENVCNEAKEAANKCLQDNGIELAKIFVIDAWKYREYHKTKNPEDLIFSFETQDLLNYMVECARTVRE